MRTHDFYEPRVSVVHQSDARVKVILTLAFILAINLLPPGTWANYLLFLSLIFSAEILSRLGIGYHLKRSLLALPFVLAALPLLFTLPSPYHSIPIFGVNLQISQPGLERFLSIAVRSWISIQAAILLAASTRFPDLMIALRMLKIPPIFVAIISLMWRYLFVIIEEATRLERARSSRSGAAPYGSARPGGRVWWRAKVTGGMVGNLFLRSLERSDRIYAAMLSRGYNGNPPTATIAPLNRQETLTIVLGLLTFLFLLFTGLTLGV
ncbi:MAG TPA: cobalt ECF transporter T component CbiQ [Anaerolineaceae bacterium]